MEKLVEARRLLGLADDVVLRVRRLLDMAGGSPVCYGEAARRAELLERRASDLSRALRAVEREAREREQAGRFAHVVPEATNPENRDPLYDRDERV